LVEQKREDLRGDEMAQWLEDSGRRRAIRLDESPEALLGLVEKISGAKLRSADDITTYFERLRLQEAERQQAETKRRALREGFLVAMLIVSAAQYYYWDVSLQIASLHKVHYFVAPLGSGPRSTSTLVATA